jgi:protein-S-isoprenylcysteine O-methyltransferase Ste14
MRVVRQEAAGGGPPDAAGVLAPPPAIYLAGLGVGFGLDWLLPSVSLPDSVRWPLALALLAAGGGLIASFVKALRAAQTAVRPDRPSTAIVTDGPYRFTRNPGYLGMALVFAGIAVGTDALWALAALVPTLVVVDRGVVAREERYLERKFGAQYRAYRERARRWL